MKATRPYRQTARAAAREETRRRIVDAAYRAFVSHWYDEVTLSGIAAEAGVSQQTVINHFGTKEALVAQAIERFSEGIQSRRDEPPAGDVEAFVRATVEDYELTGDTVIRALAVEPRFPTLAPHLARGRAKHREWCETKLGATGAKLPLVVVATDVYTWKLLRRDQGLSKDETARAMLALVTAVLDDRRS